MYCSEKNYIYTYSYKTNRVLVHFNILESPRWCEIRGNSDIWMKTQILVLLLQLVIDGSERLITSDVLTNKLFSSVFLQYMHEYI
jgi:hypothetical protein